MMIPKPALLTAVAVALLTAGCTANKMHRPESVLEEPGYTLTFIEFDDQGELWDPTRLARTLSLIERANEHERGTAVFLYVHGWQHNASKKSEEKPGGSSSPIDPDSEPENAWR